MACAKSFVAMAAHLTQALSRSLAFSFVFQGECCFWDTEGIWYHGSGGTRRGKGKQLTYLERTTSQLGKALPLYPLCQVESFFTPTLPKPKPPASQPSRFSTGVVDNATLTHCGLSCPVHWTMPGQWGRALDSQTILCNCLLFCWTILENQA